MCSSRFIDANSEQQLHDRHEVDRFLPYRKILCDTEDIVKETLTNVVSFPFRFFHTNKGNILINLCPIAASRCSLDSVSADSLMPSLVNRSPSVKFKSHMVLSIC
jgi:hypothetical protein